MIGQWDAGEKRIRVMIVDDHRVTGAGLAAIISDEPDMEVVAEAGHGAGAVMLHARVQPDVSLIDWSMPGKNGAETISAIRHDSPAARIAILTIYGEPEEVQRAIDAGAHACLLKDSGKHEILQAIRAIHNGQTCLVGFVRARVDNGAVQDNSVIHEEVKG